MFRAAFILAVALAGACQTAVGTKNGQFLANHPSRAPGQSAEIEWRTVRAPQGDFLMAVSRHADVEPKPAIILLHGTHGFAREYVALAESFAGVGFVGVAVCWFAGGSGAGRSHVTPLDCPSGTPPIVMGTGDDANDRVSAIIEAVRKLPGVDRNRVVLFGHSRGGVAALNYAVRGGYAAALVLNSAAYPDELVRQAVAVSMPVLILHGEKDSPADGGSAMTATPRAHIFVEAMGAADKTVMTHFYEGGSHNSLFTDRFQRADSVGRVENFVRVNVGQRVGAVR